MVLEKNIKIIISGAETEISNLDLDELEKLKSVVNIVIKEKRIDANTIYTHDCYGSSKHHFGKYNHWAKVIKKIDDTKTNGYAFIGDFISIEKENIASVGDYVVEVCASELKLYKALDKNEKELLAEGRYNSFVSFIKECKEITEL